VAATAGSPPARRCFHDFDESITIIEGQSACQVAGREYLPSGCDTACIPRGRPLGS
jgi:hypothetical protein